MGQESNGLNCFTKTLFKEEEDDDDNNDDITIRFISYMQFFQ